MSIIEAMASVALLGIVLLASAQGMSMSYKTTKRAVRESEALQLAVEKMEQLASIDPASLSSAYDATESLVSDNISFVRTTTVTVNADTSRTVQVQVTGTATGQGGDITISNTFALWGNA